MAKKPQKTNLYLQAAHSRNTNDWSVRVDDSGRYAFEADGMGVLLRMGIITDFLGDGGATSESIGEHLESIHPSYSKNDVGQPLKQMRKLGMLTTSGKGRGTVYTLVPNAKAILKAARKVWI